MLRDARVQDLLVRDVHVGLTWKSLEPPPADPFTADEWDRIATWFHGRAFPRKLVWAQHPSFHAYVFFLRWHGARPSEAAALAWDNVDLDAGIAYIRASYHHGAVNGPKTRTARRSIELHPEMFSILRALRPLRPVPGQPVFTNLDGNRLRPTTFGHTWTRCLQALRIRHRGIYALKDTFVTDTLATAETSGEVERLTAWLVRQTGVLLGTLRRHYERWWPRDQDSIRATYRLLDPSVSGTNCHPIVTGTRKNLGGTPKRWGTESPRESVAQRFPAHVPEGRYRRPQLGVAAEAGEARPVDQALPDEVQVVLDRLARRRAAEVDAARDAALAARHIDLHGSRRALTPASPRPGCATSTDA